MDSATSFGTILGSSGFPHSSSALARSLPAVRFVISKEGAWAAPHYMGCIHIV